MPKRTSAKEPNVLPEDVTDALLGDLNPEQLRAVTHGHGPLLIIAGAGTGKTTVIARRIAWLVREEMAKTQEILAVTFTEKAAGEMEERVDRLLPLGYSDTWIHTFHGFCQRLLKNHALEIGLPDDFRLLTETDAYLLIRHHLDQFNLNHYRPLGNPNKFIRALLKHFSRLKDEAVTPEVYLDYAKQKALDRDRADFDDAENARLQELADAYHVYQRLLLEAGCLDFGDLIMYALRLLRERPTIAAKYRAQFKQVIVDEFQDTNWAQYELLKLIVPADGNLSVVGDDDQAIYKFRGASIANIMQFKSDFPNAREVVLTRNYRSGQKILDLAYDFIRQNDPNRLEAQLAGRTTADGQALTKRLTAAKDIEARVECNTHASLEDEAAGVAERILKLRESDHETSWGDICVLARSNSSAESFSQELARRGIPFQFLALKGLYAKPIIMDLLAWFTLLDDYHESPACFRTLSSPPFRIDGTDLVAISHEARRRSESIFEVITRHVALKLLPETHATLDKLLALIAGHTQLARDKSASEVVVRYVYDSGYAETLRLEATAEDRERASLLNQFISRLRRFEQGTDEPTVRNFLAEYRLERDSGEAGSLAFDPEAGPDVVKIMTVHAAKGLEFDHVFVVCLADKRFPSTERGGDIELPTELIKEKIPEGDIHLEEERRLFYVALTRARRGLYLSYAEDYGGKTRRKPSRFLVEVKMVEPPVKVSKEKKGTIPEVPTVPTVRPLGAPEPPACFSFTQIAAYASCPLQYKFAHVLKLPIFGKPSFSFGRSMHNTLEKFMVELSRRRGQGQASLFGPTPTTAPKLPITKDELFGMYEACWQDDWFPDKPTKKKYREHGQEILEKFYERTIENTPHVLMTEAAFKIRIGKYWFKGRIDRVDQLPSGGVEIVDYKTGRPKEDGKLKPEDKRQLMLYQIAAGRFFGLKPEKMTYLYLDDLSEVSFIAPEEDLSEVEAELEKEIEKVVAGDFTPTPGWQCAFFDFADICEFRD